MCAGIPTGYATILRTTRSRHTQTPNGFSLLNVTAPRRTRGRFVSDATFTVDELPGRIVKVTVALDPGYPIPISLNVALKADAWLRDVAPLTPTLLRTIPLASMNAAIGRA